MPGRVIIVQGAQYGSEAKGAVTDAIPRGQYDIAYAVRTGGINAGHTVVRDYDGATYKMQQLPVTWANHPDIKLVIGAGALVHIPTLTREINTLIEAGWFAGESIETKLLIDYRARPHLYDHEVAASSNGGIAIGATGKGVSHAVIDRIADRREENWTDLQSWLPIELHPCLADTETVLNDALDDYRDVLLEGTQGTLLDISLGRYPYVTHKQTTPATWMAEAGLSPSLPTEVWLVARMCPIRVAGTSGFLPLETTWPDLLMSRQRAHMELYGVYDCRLPSWDALLVFAERMGMAYEQAGERAESPLWLRTWMRDVISDCVSYLGQDDMVKLRTAVETTTVTKLPRRIGRFDETDFDTALRQTRPTYVAATFMDYVVPRPCYDSLPTGKYHTEVRRWTDRLERHMPESSKLRLLTWGPTSDDRVWL